MKKGRVERKIDYEYIMYLYDKAKKMKNLDNKKELFKQIKILEKNIGKFIIKPID